VLREWRRHLDESVAALRTQLVQAQPAADSAQVSAGPSDGEGATASLDWLRRLLESAQELQDAMPTSGAEREDEDGGDEQEEHLPLTNLVQHLQKLQLPMAHTAIQRAAGKGSSSLALREHVAEMLLLLDRVRSLKAANNRASSFAVRRLQHEQELRIRAQQLEHEVVPQLQLLEQKHKREAEAHTVAEASAKQEMQTARAAERAAQEILKEAHRQLFVARHRASIARRSHELVVTNGRVALERQERDRDKRRCQRRRVADTLASTQRHTQLLEVSKKQLRSHWCWIVYLMYLMLLTGTVGVLQAHVELDAWHCVG
jgi:hypothetical protein